MHALDRIPSRRQLRDRIERELRARAAASSVIDCVPESSPYIPQSPTEKQVEFLGLDCFEALYGGSAGGGKSSCLLIGAIGAASSGASVLVLRRTFADLNLPGAIMDRSHAWLRETDASWSGKDKRWKFHETGGTLQFGYLDTEADRYRYQGAEFHQIYFDELTQFTEAQYTYLLSRVRRKDGDRIPLKVRSASNPGGIGHDWVYRRFVEARNPDLRFVPAKLEDNPFIEQESYRKALEKLDATTRAQLLDGLWVRDDGGQLYAFDPGRNICEDYPRSDSGAIRYILGVDLGASSKQKTTAFCVVAYSARVRDTIWIVESESYSGLMPSTIAEHMRAFQAKYSGFEKIVCDAGALGAGYVLEFNRRHALPVREAKKKDKLGYRRILNGDLERGELLIVRRGNKELIEELQSLQWDAAGLDAQKGQPDHLSDSMLYAFREAKAYLSVAPDLPPADRHEWAKWEEKRMKKHLMQKSANTKRERLRGVASYD